MGEKHKATPSGSLVSGPLVSGPPLASYFKGCMDFAIMSLCYVHVHNVTLGSFFVVCSEDATCYILLTSNFGQLSF